MVIEVIQNMKFQGLAQKLGNLQNSLISFFEETMIYNDIQYLFDMEFDFETSDLTYFEKFFIFDFVYSCYESNRFPK